MGKSFRNNNQEPEITNPVRKELGRYIVHIIYIPCGLLMMDQPEKDQTVVFQALKCPYSLPPLYGCKSLERRFLTRFGLLVATSKMYCSPQGLLYSQYYQNKGIIETNIYPCELFHFVHIQIIFIFSSRM